MKLPKSSAAFCVDWETGNVVGGRWSVVGEEQGGIGPYCPARVLSRRERLRPWSRRPTVAARSSVSFTRLEGRSPRRSAKRRKVSVSANEPLAMPKNCRNSLVPCRSAPSAMFAGTDVAARRSWLVIPNRSSAGNSADNRHTVSASPIDCCQTSRSR